MSFTSSSRNIRLQGNNVLAAQCKRADGQTFADSTLNLDTCLGNVDGQFQWGSRDFSQSAQNVRLEGTNLSADLRRKDGGSNIHATINLDERISNDNGSLRF